MEGIEVDRFLESLKHENANLEMLRDREPIPDRLLLMLCMATAANCMDWSEPRMTLDACKDSIKSVTGYAVTLRDSWTPPGRLVLDPNFRLEQDEWNDLFMEAQSMGNDLLHLHLDSFGSDTEEKIMHAYNETVFCLTYMISAGCARCLDENLATERCIKDLDEVFDFIGKNCKRVEM